MRFHPWAAALAAALVAGIGVLLFEHGATGPTDARSRSTTPAPPVERIDSASAAMPASGLPAGADGSAPARARAEAPAATDAGVWRSERAAFLSDRGFAAAIQKALADPSAARLFYARLAIDRCSSLRALGVLGAGGAVERNEPALADVTATCEQALALNDNTVEFFAKLRAARAGASDQAILDALDGRAGAQGHSIAQRFDAAAATDDPLLLAEVGDAWLRSPGASLDGTPIGDEAGAIFHEAWALAACEATASCETSVGAIRLCAVRQLCSGPMRSRLQAVYSKEDYALLAAHAERVAGALRSKDFSAFR